MILITGGTGFIGKSLILHLSEMGHQVRTIIRPSTKSPDLPYGVPVDITVTSLKDERGLRAAMVGVKTVYHLASAEWKGTQASLMDIDIQGTRAVVQAAEDAEVERFFFISHLGADRASAFPVLKAKAIAEEFIRRSDLDYTIIRSAIVYGPGDGFTTGIARIMSALPIFFLHPGSGNALLQPIWINDLATCLTWALDFPETINRMIEIGGPEYFSFNQICEMVMQTINIKRILIGIRPPYLRAISVLLESLFPNLPVSVYWLDYLATNRTCALDSMPRTFNLMPSRFSQQLDYLCEQNWRISILHDLLRRAQ